MAMLLTAKQAEFLHLSSQKDARINKRNRVQQSRSTYSKRVTWDCTSHRKPELHVSAGEGSQCADEHGRCQPFRYVIGNILNKEMCTWLFRCITDVKPALQLFWTMFWGLRRCALYLTTSIYIEENGERASPGPFETDRRTDGAVMFESTGNAAKTLSIARPHTIIFNVTPTTPTTHTLKHL